MALFQEQNLPKTLLEALEDRGFSEMTPIQEQVLPIAFTGRDLVGVAKTGTGKTLAYLLPALKRWSFNKEKVPQILVVVPTRELVLQVVQVAESLTTHMSVSVMGVYGGVPMARQMGLARDGCDILVATPGRLMDFVLKGLIKLKFVKILVIDEVDEMMELGLRHQLITIMDLLPGKEQKMFFTATYTPDIQILSHSFLSDPELIATSEGLVDLIEQYAYEAPNFFSKVNLLEHLLKVDAKMTKVLVFAGTKRRADQIAEALFSRIDKTMGVLHSNKAQDHRNQTIAQFRTGEINLLITSDILARGMDIEAVSHVINFDLPDTPEDFLHRTGRTGRADAKGVAISFISPDETDLFGEICAFILKTLPIKLWPLEVEKSEQLLKEEMPSYKMKNPAITQKEKPIGGGAYHAKKRVFQENKPVSKSKFGNRKDNKKSLGKKRK